MTEWWILFWTIAIFIALGVLVYRVWRNEFADLPRPPPQETHIEVDGKKFIVRGNCNRIIVRHNVVIVPIKKKEKKNDNQ